MGAAPGLIYGYVQWGAAGGLIAFLHRGLTGRLLVATILLACSLGRAENVGCMVYNNQLRFSEEELQRLEAAKEIQYVGVQIGGASAHLGEVASRLAAAGKKLVIQIWWDSDPPFSWSRFSMANIAMDAKIRANFFREVVDPILDSVGPENVHAVHMLEETAACFATDMLEPGDPENLLDGTGGVYDSPFYNGYSARDSYGGPWMLTLRRHNNDFKRFSGGFDLFEAAIWKGAKWGAFRRWVGQRVQALANNRFAEHLHRKYPTIRATTWDGPNFGGNVWSDTPAMMNHIDGFTANCYNAPVSNYIFARSLRTLDYDKELEFIAAIHPWNKLDANARRTALTAIYAVGSNIVSLWHEPNRCYQNDDLWKMMRGIYGKFSRLPVFRHRPQVFVIAGRWDVPSLYLKNFDVAHAYDAEGVGLNRYKLVLALGTGHPGLKEYVAEGGLAVVFEHHPAFLIKENLIVPSKDKPREFSGTFQPDEWWRENFGLKQDYKLNLKWVRDFSAGKDVRKAGHFVYHVRYGKGQVLVFPGKPVKEGREPDWQFFVYDLIGGLLHSKGLDQVFDRHFAPRDSGGRYMEITSDDGSVTCYFQYSTNQKGSPVQIKGIDILTGDKDPVLGPERSAAIVAHRKIEEWKSPPVPNRTRKAKIAEKGARRSIPDLLDLPAVTSLGPAGVALKPGTAPAWTAKEKFDGWAVSDCRYRLVIRLKAAATGAVDQPLVLSGKELYELTGLENLSWQSVRVFAKGKELPIQVDERDGTGHYKVKGNSRLDYDDELVFAVSRPAGNPIPYTIYYDHKPPSTPRNWPLASVTFKKISTNIADAVLSNGRLTAHLKGPAKHPGEHNIENYGAGAITHCGLDGKGFTNIHYNWGNFFFGHPFSGSGEWTMPKLFISGPLRSIVRIHLPTFSSKNKSGQRTFEGKVTHYFAMYGDVPILDIEQRIEYQWSDRKWTANYTFYTRTGGSLDAEDLLFVPVAGKPQRMPMFDVGIYDRRYQEHRPEQGWMALLDSREKHGCALFYARMPEVRENLAWVDYAPRREITPSVNRWTDGYPMHISYTNRVMQTDNVIDRRFRITGLTGEDEHSVNAQYLIWGEDLIRMAEIEVQVIRKE